MTLKLTRKLHGFSMIELVIVIVIIGSISTIAVPKFADAGSGRRLSAAKKTLIADVETAKLRARATSKIHVIKFYPDENRYIIFEGEDLKRESIVLVQDFDEEPYSVEINRTNLGADPYAVITAYGDVSPGFRIGILENGTEITVDIDGVSDVGVTPLDNISPLEVIVAPVVDLLSGLFGK